MDSQTNHKGWFTRVIHQQAQRTKRNATVFDTYLRIPHNLGVRHAVHRGTPLKQGKPRLCQATEQFYGPFLRGTESSCLGTKNTKRNLQL